MNETRILTVSVTAAGKALAERLPFEHAHGDAARTVRERWPHLDGLVLVLAAGAAMRIVAPLLSDKRTDPAVVCVDDAGRYAISLCGGHGDPRDPGRRPGANALARQIADLIGAEAVLTSASDEAGVSALDALPGFRATGDVAAVGAAALEGRAPFIENTLGWPLPKALAGGPGPERVVITDRLAASLSFPPERPTAYLYPPSLVAGVGTSVGAPADEVGSLLDHALESADLARDALGEIATIDRRSHDPAVRALGPPVRAFGAEELAAVVVPTPSEAVASAVGTPSVAEAAALLAAGPGGELVVSKRKSRHATVAIARRCRPRGRLSLVGLGPGGGAHRTPAADSAVRAADTVIGYGPYLDQCADLLRPGQEVVRSPIGAEADRAERALAAAAAGGRVALVCSGDAGVYAMASVTLELAGRRPEHPSDTEIEVVPGVTAALAAAALLGAPLGHDHASISLSDLNTPWPLIEERLGAAAAADLVVSLYNPRSSGRTWQLEAARQIFLSHRKPSTPVGVVTDAGRPGERSVLTTLAELDPEQVGMTTCVVIGSSSTWAVAGRMVTPRGHNA